MSRGLPLQPDLRPRDPARWRWRLSLAALLALTLSAWLLPAWRNPPRLLTNQHQEWQWFAQLRRHIAAAHSTIDAIVFVAHIGAADDHDHPMRVLIADLAAAQARGVRVRVVLDRSRDWGSDTISSKNDAAASALQAVGIPVFSDETSRTTHSKAWVFDQRWVIVGSHNWTRSAATRNREWSVLLDDPDIAGQITRQIDQLHTPYPHD